MRPSQDIAHPNWRQMPQDPLIRALMDADGVSESSLLQLLKEVHATLCRAEECTPRFAFAGRGGTATALRDMRTMSNYAVPMNPGRDGNR